MNDGKTYSQRKVGMPCFAVLMSVYLSYLSRDLCIMIQVQFRLYIYKRGLNALRIPSLLLG